MTVRASAVPRATVKQRGWTPLGVYGYRTYLVAGTSHLYAYATHAAGCPAVRLDGSVDR